MSQSLRPHEFLPALCLVVIWAFDLSPSLFCRRLRGNFRVGLQDRNTGNWTLHPFFNTYQVLMCTIAIPSVIWQMRFFAGRTVNRMIF
ncbi:hypothetical protein F4821DRAFT_168203 [Hypoxylon rubiginosum]|uniref:Uncharacterized protein n=1 Tax=Hypoxylon rubiginosum TaxID=110542 RepID=A0ACC0CVU3_9PEZI|nr:hypothetical protein F4821DRAFT_168203 [Hypoxylon rubiginosum]